MSIPNPDVTSTATSGRTFTAGAIIMLAAGVVLALIGFGPLVGGIATAAVASQRADDGFLRSPSTTLSTGGYALTSPDFHVDTDMGEVPGQLVKLQAEATAVTGSSGIFVGVGPREKVAAYLSGVAHSVVVDVRYSPKDVHYRNVAGDQVPSAPEDQTFWAVSDAGQTSADIETTIRQGDWVLVVMNRDASQNVNVEARVGANSELFIPVAVVLMLLGATMIAGGVILIAFGARLLGKSHGLGSSAEIESPAAPSPFPARLEGNLAKNSSRALWLVKWILLVPHLVILFFLWFALIVTTVIAWFAILFTGRYPRSLFDFNVGVIRWSWRVAFYGYSVLGTDEYPPFTLAPTAYPAGFDVLYPKRLSRGLVLVKSWLLALPHLVIISILTGGASWTVWNRGESSSASAPALLGVLVLVAAIILLFTGRYRTSLFDLIMGINRWNYRVLAYVLLMTDEYPPFRLDQGPFELTTETEPRTDGTFGPTATDGHSAA